MNKPKISLRGTMVPQQVVEAFKKEGLDPESEQAVHVNESESLTRYESLYRVSDSRELDTSGMIQVTVMEKVWNLKRDRYGLFLKNQRLVGAGELAKEPDGNDVLALLRKGSPHFSKYSRET